MFIAFQNQCVRPIIGAQVDLRPGINYHAALYGLAVGDIATRSSLKPNAAFWPEASFICPGCQKHLSLAHHYVIREHVFCSVACAMTCESLIDMKRDAVAPVHFLDSPETQAKVQMLDVYRSFGRSLQTGVSATMAQWMKAFSAYSAFSFDLASMALCKHDALPNGTSRTMCAMIEMASEICVTYHNLGHYSLVASDHVGKAVQTYATDDDLLNESLARRVAASVADNIASCANALFDNPSPVMHAAGDRILNAWNNTLAGLKPPYRIGERENGSDLNLRRN